MSEKKKSLFHFCFPLPSLILSVRALSLVERRFLSAAQATDQGEESVVLVVVVKEDHFSVSHVQFFWGY